ncbi:DUF1330 domain-containing protein [Litoreibacter roseus]|uniref:DUF1330 domain-containing protein n=1 Tax=Litoreibacter roseus TaxID=2601869 RepID=A0A6N6JHV9_9RHOB|nr:DUF1330 domain-containing protein [Litoreibacter roseus]GFE65921.1 hypothetical protein KIN_29950 [Litoreibacter roseus]
MAKAYWVAHVDVHDADTYDAYRAANAEPFAKYGARFVVRGGTQEVREGAAKKRTVVIEFKDLATAVACYESPEYQRAKEIRDPVSDGDLVIVEGYDPV